jgi:hypothetical protein
MNHPTDPKGQHVMLKKSQANADNGSESHDGESASTYRDNPQINAKIDEHIKNNPKYWEYLQAMPRERMERAMVLHEVQKDERQQKLEAGILKKLEGDPELKKTYENLVKDLPEDQRQKAMVSIASRTMRDIASRQSRSQGGVKV